MNLSQAKRVFLISDTHFGCRANSREWLNVIKDYFYNFFIPFVIENYKEGDVLFHLGDMFDNRQSVNLFVLKEVIDIFEKLSEIFPEIHILTGNHDTARKLDNEITSLEIFKHFHNITVYKEANMIDLGKKRALMMPWRRDGDHEVETLVKYSKADFVFCHSEVAGLQLSKNPRNRHDGGNSVNVYKNFGKVYSGHIHYRQKKKNFLLVGNPYEMTRSDSRNLKGIYILDIESGEDTFYPNEFSPKFLKVNLKDILETNLEDFKKFIDNNFVDLFISSEVVMKYNLSSLMSMLEGHARKVEPHIYDTEQEIDLMMSDEDGEAAYKNFDIMTVSKKYVSALPYEEPMKKKLMKSLLDLYEEAGK